MLRTLLAPNASPMTLDGTRTHLVGTRAVVVIDPGPDDAGHLDAIVAALDGAAATVVLTHMHPDHAAGADGLAARLNAPVRAVAYGTLGDGERLETDAGELVALATPGHTPDHIALHWPARRALFCGDLLMGGLDTALVAPPEGDLADYLASLDRLSALDARVIHPAHGPDIRDPAAAFERYRRHREERLDQVRAARAAGHHGLDSILSAVYGESVPDGLRAVARDALRAYLDYLDRH